MFRAHTKGGRARVSNIGNYILHICIYIEMIMYLGNYYLPQTKRSRSAREHHWKLYFTCAGNYYVHWKLLLTSDQEGSERT